MASYSASQISLRGRLPPNAVRRVGRHLGSLFFALSLPKRQRRAILGSKQRDERGSNLYSACG